jgi:hypothetical protein
MRRKGRPPLNRRYFHTKPKVDKRDIAIIKKKIYTIDQKKYKEELEKAEKKTYRRQ